MVQAAFTRNAKLPQTTLHVLVLGAGLMGQRHVASLREISEKVLADKGVTLKIAAVDKNEAQLTKLPPDVARFATLEEALAAQKPDIALMAFNDNQHTQAFKVLFERAPGLKAVLSEKPLTEYLADAYALEPELRKRYLSMNTVINFSPVFDRLAELQPASGLAPMGFEAVWGKNRTADTRPSIGIPSESVHALSVVSDMFAQGEMRLESGAAKQGDLSVNAKDVIYEMQTVFRGDTGLPMRFHASYVFPEQQRRVTAYYAAPDDKVLAVEMDFDVKVAGVNKDRLRIHSIDAKTGEMTTLLDEYPDKIVNGAEPGVLKNDRITAFNSLSLLDYLTPPEERSAALASRLSNLDAALQVQGEVEQITKDNKRLKVQPQDADPAQLSPSKLPELQDATPADRAGRIAQLQKLRQPPVAPKPAAKKVRPSSSP